MTTCSLPFDLSGVRPPDAAVTGFTMVTPERLEMTVSTSQPALLTLALANYPGWRATVNGVDVPLIDTYAGLIGVPISAGQAHSTSSSNSAPLLLYAEQDFRCSHWCWVVEGIWRRIYTKSNGNA
ncbi:MAG: hypothetical protein U0694_21755 [Anaerolineae bacterium]